MTYSVVARDKNTGQLGVAVQTHWFGVGNNVPWLEAGVGAVATQAQTNMNYGKKGLELLEQGKTLDEAFDEISKNDEALNMRQVAMIDNTGKILTHTGDGCVKYADYIIGDEFVVQGNLLTNQEVLPAMKKAYEDNIGNDFAQRLYLCIKAGEQAGGELRGVQSAALRIVPGNRDKYYIVNLRIDDNKKPLDEINRQLELQRAYNTLALAEEEGEVGSVKDSLKLFEQVFNIIPESKEALFWKAYMLRNRGRIRESQKIFGENFEGEEMWKELWNRIS